MAQGTGIGGTGVTTKHVGLDFYFFEKNTGSGSKIYFGLKDGTGIDVIFRSAVAGAEITWDESLAKWIMDGVDLQLEDSDELRFGDLAAGDIVMNFDGSKFELEGAAAATSWNIGADSKLLNTTLKGTLTIGKDGTGHDVIIHGDSTGAETTFDQANDKWIHDGITVQLNDEDELRFGSLAAGDITMNFDGAKFELEGAAAATSWNIGATSKLLNTTLHGTLTIGESDTGYDVIIHGDSPGAESTFDQANDKWVHDGISVQLNDTDELRFGDLPAGDIVMNFDSSKFETTGAAAATSWYIGADSKLINITLKGELTIGKSGTGHDVLIYGNSALAVTTFDQTNDKWTHDGIVVQLQDEDELRFGDLAAGDILMNFDSTKFELEGAAANTSWEIGKDSKNINIILKGTLTIGKNDEGHDVVIYGASTGSLTTFDEANDKWVHDGIAVQLNDEDELRFGDLAAGDIVMNFDGSIFETTGAASVTSWIIGAGGNVINTVQTGTVDIIGAVDITGAVDVTGILTMETVNAIQLRDSDLKIWSSGDGQLDFASDGVIKLDGKLTHMDPLTETLSGNKVLSVNATRTQFLDPDGARTLTLPITASSAGFPMVIVNKAGGAEAITVIDASANTIATIDQNEIGIFFCDGSSWAGGIMPQA